jgi:hypothetical protein
MRTATNVACLGGSTVGTVEQIVLTGHRAARKLFNLSLVRQSSM